MVLLLVIFLFGLLILSMNKNKPCGCTRKVVYREKGYNPYVIRNIDTQFTELTTGSGI
jgi:hypothetical protein